MPLVSMWKECFCLQTLFVLQAPGSQAGHLPIFTKPLYCSQSLKARTDWATDTRDKNNTEPCRGLTTAVPRLRPSVCRQARNFLHSGCGPDGCNINTRGQEQIQQRDCRESGHWTDFLSMVVIEAFYDYRHICATIFKNLKICLVWTLHPHKGRSWQAKVQACLRPFPTPLWRWGVHARRRRLAGTSVGLLWLHGLS